MRSDNDITFPIAYGAEPEKLMNELGCYISDDLEYVHATGFIIKPDNTVDTVVYSTGAIGRLTAEDTLGMLDYYASQT